MARAWYYLKFIIRKALELIKIPFFLLFDSFALIQSTPASKKGTLILRFDAIGDYMLFRNFIKHYVSAFGPHTFFMIRAPLAVLYESLDHIRKDRLIIFDPKKFEVNLRYRIKMLMSIRRFGFHRVIQPNYSRYFFVEECMVRLTGADEKIGIIGSFNNIGFIPHLIAQCFYSRYYQLPKDITFEFIRNKEITSLICKKDIYEEFGLEIPKSQSGEIIIAPGAGVAYRKWAPDNFAKLITLLNQKYNSTFRIIGSAEDEQIAEKIISSIGDMVKVKSLCGKLNLLETTQCIANAFLLITNETGPAHIGAMTKTNTICISNGNHYGRFHPYPSSLSTRNYYIYPEILAQKIHSGNTEAMKKTLKLRSVYDINGITVERVIEKALEIL